MKQNKFGFDNIEALTQELVGLGDELEALSTALLPKRLEYVFRNLPPEFVSAVGKEEVKVLIEEILTLGDDFIVKEIEPKRAAYTAKEGELNSLNDQKALLSALDAAGEAYGVSGEAMLDFFENELTGKQKQGILKLDSPEAIANAILELMPNTQPKAPMPVEGTSGGEEAGNQDIFNNA